MGIVNVTPDSFSDGGKLDDVDAAVAQALALQEQGAAIVDIGGESTRPGADPVSADEEQGRVLPVIAALKQRSDVLISIDTYRAETAELAVTAGAHIINDVWGCQKEEEIAEVASKNRAGICVMHTGRDREKASDVIEDQREFLKKSLEILKNANVGDDQIVLDPGFGFAKDPAENIELLARLDELLEFELPLMIGTSRKRFIGHFTGNEVDNRDIGTAATSVVARMKGGAIFRVHDVEKNRDALSMADAVIEQTTKG